MSLMLELGGSFQHTLQCPHSLHVAAVFWEGRVGWE